MRKLLSFMLLSLAAVSIGAEVPDDNAGKWTSANGLYRVSYKSNLEPLRINTIHNWIIHIEDSSGTAVSGATLMLVGGMPVHDHGLPTRPQMTNELGDGDYLIEGMRFHMAGYWEIEVSIDAAGKQDVATISFDL